MPFPVPRAPSWGVVPLLMVALLAGTPLEGIEHQSAVEPRTATADTTRGDWNSQAALTLLRRGQEARREQVDLGTLQSYEALTEGHIYFYVDTDEGEQALIRVDQVAVELFWQAPDRIRQRIVGERSETRLPVRDFRYYLDRLTLVQYGFEDEIQVGQGLDVAGVPHPLAPAPGGDPDLYPYDIQLGEAVVLRLPGEPEPLAVQELRVRPRDPSRPGFVGSVFLSERDAQIVRMTFSFTPASYVDRRTDWIRVSLDYGLWEGRYWLPNRQELEVRRELPELDLGVGTVIRAVLRVGGYELNVPIPEAILNAPAVTQFPESFREGYAFREGLYDAMERDGVGRVQVDVDPRRIREETARLIGNQPPTGLAPFRPHLPAFSSLVRADPYRGLTIGGGASWRPQGTVRVRSRLGVSMQTGRLEGSAIVDGIRYEGFPLVIRANLNESMDRSARPAGPGLLSSAKSLTLGESDRSPWRRTGIDASTTHRLSPETSIRVTAGLARHRAERMAWITPPLGSGSRIIRRPPRIAEGTLWELGANLEHTPAFVPLDLPGQLVLTGRGDALVASGGIGVALQGGADWRHRSPDQKEEVKASVLVGLPLGRALPQQFRTLGGPETLPGLPFADRVGRRWILGSFEGSREVSSPWVRARGGIDVGWTADGRGQTTGIRAGVGIFYDIVRIETARVIWGYGTQHGWRLQIGVDPLWWPYL